MSRMINVQSLDLHILGHVFYINRFLISLVVSEYVKGEPSLLSKSFITLLINLWLKNW